MNLTLENKNKFYKYYRERFLFNFNDKIKSIDTIIQYRII